MTEATEINESSNQDKEHPLTQRAIKILGELGELNLSLKAIGRAVGKSDRTLRNILWGTRPSELLVNALEMYLKHQKEWYANFKSQEAEAEAESASKVQEGGSSYASLHRLIEIAEKSYALQEKSHFLLQTLAKGDKNEENEEVPPPKKRSKKQSPPDYPNSKEANDPPSRGKYTSGKIPNTQNGDATPPSSTQDDSPNME